MKVGCVLQGDIYLTSSGKSADARHLYVSLLHIWLICREKQGCCVSIMPVRQRVKRQMMPFLIRCVERKKVDDSTASLEVIRVEK